MIEDTIRNNQVRVEGKVMTNLMYIYTAYGENFYTFKIGIERASGYIDEIPVHISERLLLSNVTLKKDDFVLIDGQYRSRNEPERHLNLHVFARQIYAVDEPPTYINDVMLRGFICKEPIYRATPLGREIADILLAVNRNYNKSDYLPCIVWGRNARYASILPVGTEIVLTGRIQSRKYTKEIKGEICEKMAYEMSGSLIRIVEK